ncbi:hypothetical protein [Streptomyces sp. NBC_00654]|uniref:hypothetical protein n=1 Tax=Streptomyces sp. NBC_00654 TaxID=2975799 RepID=UPI00225AB06D|nr:hypothetical protein [Streptomyces sp. NBC_00654]MCX4967025.1 hypothetical protein [Streptomyces sp. NBC_00654]
MVRDNGEATVVDFGITKSGDGRHDITTTGVLIGTLAFMAPEALSDTPHRFTGTSWHLIPAHQRATCPDCALCVRTLLWNWSSWSPCSWPGTASPAPSVEP